MNKKIGKALEDVAQYISLSQIAKSIGKDRSWLYHKMKNDIVNGVEYRFNVSEYALLAERLHKLAEDIHRCAEELDSVVQDANRTAGRYYTNENVFEYPLFKEWLKLIPELERTTILEPFAGECSIPKILEQYGFTIIRIPNNQIKQNFIRQQVPSRYNFFNFTAQWSRTQNRASFNMMKRIQIHQHT